MLCCDDSMWRFIVVMEKSPTKRTSYCPFYLLEDKEFHQPPRKRWCRLRSLAGNDTRPGFDVRLPNVLSLESGLAAGTFLICISRYTQNSLVALFPLLWETKKSNAFFAHNIILYFLKIIKKYAKKMKKFRISSRKNYSRDSNSFGNRIRNSAMPL